MRTRISLVPAAVLVGGALLGWLLSSIDAQDKSATQTSSTVLPRPESPFKGKVGRTVKDSTPDFPKGIEAPKGAPNAVVLSDSSHGTHWCRIVISLRGVAAQLQLHARQLTDPAWVFG